MVQGTAGRRVAGALVGAVGALALAAPLAHATSIEVLSNRADLISGGDPLVAVGLPAGTHPSTVTVPPDVATTTTPEGKTVPYIVRVETGYQDRDQYQIAALFDPSQPWAPWAPQPGWNHKLLITHGASCGIDHQTGSAPSVVNDAALSRGFAVMSTALDNAGHNCSLATEAESLVMAKEHLVEAYGTIR